jgi:dTDP-4-dehydrorhamnose 3,5-epimerase-like enzyme
MIFTETELKGAFVIDLEQKHDHRGFFALKILKHMVSNPQSPNVTCHSTTKKALCEECTIKFHPQQKQN